VSNLTTFIRANIEPILGEWEIFARALPGTEPMDIVALRDHAREMLQVIASDLDYKQFLAVVRARLDARGQSAPAST
jgi:hypothetical protein